MSKPEFIQGKWVVRLCYECDTPVHWLAPDGRCAKCTRCTPEQVKGDVDESDDESDD